MFYTKAKKKINIDINLSIKAPHCCLKFGQKFNFFGK